MTSSNLADLVGAHADAVATIDDNAARTWAELDDRTRRIGRGLETIGLSPGDHVALIVTNRVEFIEAMIGAIRAGCTMTPIKTNWTLTEVSYLANDAGSRAVITDLDVGRRAAAELGLALIDIDDDFDGWVGSHDPDLPAGRRGYRIPYTSGTTGQPKGVERTSGAPTFEDWVTSSAAASAAFGLPTTGTHLMASQLFHGAPLNFGLGAMFGGATLRIMSRWDAARAISHFAEAPTASIMVPTMFRQLVALPEATRHRLPVENVTAILHGGEACPVPLKQQMIDWWGPVLTEYYGFTEGGVTVCSSADWITHKGTVGRPPPGHEVVILDEDGNELPPHETGTVYFRRPEGQFFRYRNAPDKTAAAYLDDNAFTVGDVGHLDDDGFLYLSGRTAEVIVSAGVNIYPAEIESVLFEVEGVDDACVAGGPDPERGERPVAFLQTADDADEAAVRSAVEAACVAHLAGYKRPREIIVRSEIPRDPTGKVLRLSLRAELWSDTDS